jgi:hypothetical protein
MTERGRHYRIFISGNCQLQFVSDSLKYLFRRHRDIEILFRANFQNERPGDNEAARACDVHIVQVTNLEPDRWQDIVPAQTRRIRVPLLQLAGIFHSFAPRAHPAHGRRGAPPFYLARGNRVLHALAIRYAEGGAESDQLTAEYLDYFGKETAAAPRMMEMTNQSMRRVGLHSDFDLWREIEPRLGEERFFWSVKHPTLKTEIKLLLGVLDKLELPYDAEDLAALAQGREYHEPFHAPVHPRVAAALGLAWARPETKYRYFQNYYTVAEHAKRYIRGDFVDEFALNAAINDARSNRDAARAARAFKNALSRFPAHGQAHFWYGRVLQRLEKWDQAIGLYEQALAGMNRHPHDVAHRADVTVAGVEKCLKRCRRDGRDFPNFELPRWLALDRSMPPGRNSVHETEYGEAERL